MANRKTGETVATGNIKATSGVYSFFTDRFTRSADGVYDLGENAVFIKEQDQEQNKKRLLKQVRTKMLRKSQIYILN